MNESKIVRCNLCGKEFDTWDELQNFNLKYSIQYGSTHDGEKIDCNMCCDCFDKLIDTYILPKCVENPIKNNEEAEELI